MTHSLEGIVPVSCMAGQEIELWRVAHGRQSWVLIVVEPGSAGAGVKASVELTTAQLLTLETRIRKALHGPRPGHPAGVGTSGGLRVVDGGR